MKWLAIGGLGLTAVVLLLVALWPVPESPHRTTRHVPGAATPTADEPEILVVADVTATVARARDAQAPPPEPDMMLGAIRMGDLKASVKRFYDTLPPGWRMPDKVRVDEVLPPAAIEILGVPPESLLDEISHYPLNMKTGLEIVLEFDPATTDAVGVAIILPSGRRYLDELPLVP